MEPGKIAKHPTPEIGLRLGLMLNVNQDETLLPPHLRLHHQVGLIPLVTGNIDEDLFVEKAYRVVHESGTKLPKPQGRGVSGSPVAVSAATDHEAGLDSAPIF